MFLQKCSRSFFPYQLSIVQRYGFVCYGCCEAIDKRWNIIRRIPNLRKVSVSPWCNREKMAEHLSDKYIYSLKPHPGLLAAPTLDEKAIRADIIDALKKTNGCHLEIIMKDNHTICNEPDRVVTWVRIVREEIEKMK